MSATLLNNITATLGAVARGFSSAPVQIGTVTLTGVEVPSELGVGAQQQLVVHRLPGGGKIINALGPDPERLSLSGLFTGPATAARYQAVDAMRVAGKPVPLLVAGLSYQVVVSAFRYTFAQRGAVVAFTIELEVLPALASDQPSAGTSLLSSLLGPDAASALSSVASAGLSDLSTAESFLTAAAGLSGAGSALLSTPASLSGFVTAMQGAGGALAGTAASASAALDDMAGTAPNGIASDAASLTAMLGQAQLLATSVQAGGYVNRSLAGAAQASGQAPPAPTVTS